MQKQNRAQPCFVTYLLEHQQEYGLSDAELAYLAGSMFGAGADSVSPETTQPCSADILPLHR